MHFLEALRAASIARNMEWENKTAPFTGVFWVNELSGEVGEACNIMKKLDRERLGVVGSRGSLGALQEELADVIICCDLLAMHYQCSIAEAVWRDHARIAPVTDFSRLGAQLAARSGRCCHAVLGGLETMLPITISEVVQHTKRIADLLGIDLAHQVSLKFNMTSEKVGLKTRLVL